MKLKTRSNGQTTTSHSNKAFCISPISHSSNKTIIQVSLNPHSSNKNFIQELRTKSINNVKSHEKLKVSVYLFIYLFWDGFGAKGYFFSFY